MISFIDPSYDRGQVAAFGKGKRLLNQKEKSVYLRAFGTHAHVGEKIAM